MTEEKKHKINEIEDYIDCPKYGNSIKKLIQEYPEGVEDDIIAKVLNIPVQEVENIYQSAVKKLQKSLKI